MALRKFTPDGSPNFLMITREGTKLALFEKQHGSENLLKVIALMLTKFSQSFNFAEGKNLNDTQISDLAVSLYEAGINDGFTIEDYAIFFERAKMNKYGKVFDRLDIGIVNEMLDNYFLERVSELAKANDVIQDEKKKSIIEVLANIEKGIEYHKKKVQELESEREFLNREYPDLIEAEKDLEAQRNKDRSAEIADLLAKLQKERDKAIAESLIGEDERRAERLARMRKRKWEKN